VAQRVRKWEERVSLERTGVEKENVPFQLWTVPLFWTTPLYLPYLPRSTTGAEEDEEEDDDAEEEEVGTATAEEATARRASRGVPMSILREGESGGRKAREPDAPSASLTSPPSPPLRFANIEEKPLQPYRMTGSQSALQSRRKRA
jgi:hypothetical protein